MVLQIISIQLLVRNKFIKIFKNDKLSKSIFLIQGKFCEPMNQEAFEASQKENRAIEPKLAPKRQNKSTSQIHTTRRFQELGSRPTSSYGPQTSQNTIPPTRPSRSKPSITPSSIQPNKIGSSRPKYLRSHTFIEPRLRTPKSPPPVQYPRSATGLPLVTAKQRHALTLLRLNDLFSFGINGTLRPCTSAKKLCNLLIDFTRMITSAKRKILEQHENFYKLERANEQGIRREIEMTRGQQRAARKRVVDGSIYQSLPGKLDHASVVAWMIPNNANAAQKLSIPLNYTETNF